MKKVKQISKIGFLAIALINTLQMQAQGKFMKKLASALEPKPINGVWEMAQGSTGGMAIAQTPNQFSAFVFPTKNGDEKLKIEYRGVQVYGTAIFVQNIDKVYFEPTFNMFLFQAADSTFVMVKHDKFTKDWKFDSKKELKGIITNDKKLMEELKKFDMQKDPSSELVKNTLGKIQPLIDQVNAGINKAESDKSAKDSAERANYRLPKPSPFAPAGITNKTIENAILAWKLKYNTPTEPSKYKFVYAYFSSPYQQNYLTDWKMIKEYKLVNGTRDLFITKRMLYVMVIEQTTEDMKNNTYKVTTTMLYEDAAMGVYDGSKWTGKYYIEGMATYRSSMPLGNLMEYKNSLK